MAAYEQLYRAHRDALYHRVIRPRVSSAADADDVLVDTFAAALEHLRQFEWTGKSLLSWLARIAVNKCHDVGRRRGRDDRALAALAAEPEATVSRPDAEAAILEDRAVARSNVEEVLALLTPRYAEALRLRLLEDRSREECAKLLEVKVGTFDVLLLRAVRSFRKHWAERFQGREEMGS